MAQACSASTRMLSLLPLLGSIEDRKFALDSNEAT
jgi:hypothetical protein